jgi:phospholipid/cholesterol/gamma-HCH transport system substrate-binding protein
MNSNRGKEIRVGALIAIGFLIIFAAFFVIGGQEGLFARKYELKARFANVEGLTVGAAVRLGGVKVGSVEKIAFAPDGTDKQVVVTMAVSVSSFDKIRENSKARVGGQGLLGDRTIDISVGSQSESPLKPGDFVQSLQTAGISDLISQSGDVMGDIRTAAHNLKEITYKINNGTGTMAEVINDPRLYVDIDSLLNMWTDITMKINKGQGTLAKLVNDPSLYDNLASSLSEIREFLANVNNGKGSLGRLATEETVYNRLDSLLTTAGETINKINSGSGTAGQVINNAELYQRMSSTLNALDELIADIKAHPKKYIRISIF